MKGAAVLVFLALISLATADPDLNGAWTDKTGPRGGIGGTTYTCTRGNTLYGVFSEAGWIEGSTLGYRTAGTWFSGGDPFDDVDRLWGTYDISVVDDNSGFRGYWTYGGSGSEKRWTESRKSAPEPLYPSNNLCLVPDDSSSIVGYFYGGSPAADWFVCREASVNSNGWFRIFGSFTDSDFNGSFEGFTADNGKSFFGQYYTETNAGAIFLRATSNNVARGYRWPAGVAGALLPQVRTMILERKKTSATPSFFECNTNEVFTPSSASTVTSSFVIVLAGLLAVLF